MAKLTLDRAAYPHWYSSSDIITQDYTYTETDDSEAPTLTSWPSTLYSSVCGTGDPIMFPVYISDTISAVSWSEDRETITINGGTSHAFTLDVIKSCTAKANGSDIGVFNVRGNLFTTHNANQDYHAYQGQGVSTLIFASDGTPSQYCYITEARGYLIGSFKQAKLRHVYVSPTEEYDELIGYEDVTFTTYGLSAPPVITADAKSLHGYNCVINLTKTTS